MPRFELPTEDHTHEPGFFRRHRWWLVPLLLLDAVLFIWWWSRAPSAVDPILVERVGAVAKNQSADAPESQAIGNRFGYPTMQSAILDTNTTGIFMPTASGRPESAWYGTVRMSQEGKIVLPSFHEGIDIAPLGRDRKQVPTDRIFAPLDGEVAYANRIAGNSNYGRYIVLLHDDPVGKIYSLYAHLEEVAPAVRPGHHVKRGEDIGRMGHSDSTGLHVSRAHLHYEIGVVLNRNFHAWYKKQKRKPDHGNYHGQNLMGINPLDVYRWQEERGAFSMKDYLEQLFPAFTLIVKTPKPLDYFSRYPALWSGDTYTGAIVLTVSEGGVPTGGRPATAAELDVLGKKSSAVLSVNEEILGKNGLRLVVRRQGNWQLGKNGERWLEVLTAH